MKNVLRLLVTVTLGVTAIPAAEALILCVDSGGNLSAQISCKKGWAPLDPIAVGLQGPAGPQGLTTASSSRGFATMTCSIGHVAPVSLSQMMPSPPSGSLVKAHL